MKRLFCIRRPQFKMVALFLIMGSGAISRSYGFNADAAKKTISTNGSYDDTAAAVAHVVAKSEDGWVMTIGAAGGKYTWATGLNVTIPHVFTIQGASASVRPTITITATTGFGIYLGCSEGKTITVKDIHFDAWKATNALFLIDGGGVDCFRLTNLEFTNSNTFGAWISSPGATNTKPGPYGLIDHCSFPNGGGLLFVRDNPAATPNSWHRPMSWGTKHAVYVEDCNFSAPNPLPGVWGVGDGDTGGRLVVRHCTLKNMPLGTHGADSQPLENGQNPNKSMLQVEIMHNTFTLTSGLDSFFFLRGGTATIFDNTFNTPGGGYMNVMTKTSYYRSFAHNGVCPQDRFYPADYVGTQQPGSGVVASPGQDPKNPNEPWGSVPIYVWGNKVNLPLIWGEVGGSDFTQPGRDYFIGKPRPGYTEFTYPHPLQGVAGQNNRPNPPSNIRVSSEP